MEKIVHSFSSDGWKAIYTWPLDSATEKEAGKEDDPLIMRRPLASFALVEFDDGEDERMATRIVGFTHMDTAELCNCENPLNFLGYEAPSEEEDADIEESWLNKAEDWQRLWREHGWGLGSTRKYPRLLPQLFDPISDILYLSEKHLQDLIESETGYRGA